MSSPLLDADGNNYELEAWAESRLAQTLGARKAPPINSAQDGSNVHPIFQVNMLSIPQPTLDQMDIAFHRGTDTQKRATETAATVGKKYTDRQLTHLLAFCGLQ